jgi:hypothetical protein
MALMSVSLPPCRTHTQRNIQAEDIKWKTALANACLFVALSPYGREQQQVLQRIHSQERSHLEKMPAYDALVKQLVRDEIMRWPLPTNQLFQAFLQQQFEEKYAVRACVHVAWMGGRMGACVGAS